jgi:DNA-binding MarR family transcriptional regulator
MSTAVETDTLTVAERLRPVLLRIGRELRREARDIGLSPEQTALLASIDLNPGIGVRELAARERVSPPAMSNHVDRLERDGLVSRSPHASDRRRIGLALTAEGRRMLRRVRSRRTAWLASRLGGLSPEELDAVEAAIEPLWNLLDEDERP